MPYADPDVARRNSAERMRQMRSRRSAERPPLPTAEHLHELEGKLHELEEELRRTKRGLDNARGESWGNFLSTASPGRIAKGIEARRDRKTVVAVRSELGKLINARVEIDSTPLPEDVYLAQTLLGLGSVFKAGLVREPAGNPPATGNRCR